MVRRKDLSYDDIDRLLPVNVEWFMGVIATDLAEQSVDPGPQRFKTLQEVAAFAMSRRPYVPARIRDDDQAEQLLVAWGEFLFASCNPVDIACQVFALEKMLNVSTWATLEGAGSVLYYLFPDPDEENDLIAKDFVRGLSSSSLGDGTPNQDAAGLYKRVSMARFKGGELTPFLTEVNFDVLLVCVLNAIGRILRKRVSDEGWDRNFWLVEIAQEAVEEDVTYFFGDFT